MYTSICGTWFVFCLCILVLLLLFNGQKNKLNLNYLDNKSTSTSTQQFFNKIQHLQTYSSQNFCLETSSLINAKPKLWRSYKYCKHLHCTGRRANGLSNAVTLSIKCQKLLASNFQSNKMLASSILQSNAMAT